MSKKIVVECNLCGDRMRPKGIGFVWGNESQDRPVLIKSDQWANEQCFTHICSKCIKQIIDYQQLTQQGGSDDNV